MKYLRPRPAVAIVVMALALCTIGLTAWILSARSAYTWNYAYESGPPGQVTQHNWHLTLAAQPNFAYCANKTAHWTERQITIPCWSALTCTATLLFLWVRSNWPKRLTPPGHCNHCGYDLRATPGQCPECGQVAVAPG